MDGATLQDIPKEDKNIYHWSPLFPDNDLGENDASRIYYDIFQPELAQQHLTNLQNEITWQHMYHQTGQVPRLVCCQSTISADGSRPVYRHPSDKVLPSQPWTTTTDKVRQAAEHIVGHPLNHALIQMYRSGEDHITEHSDKTLDVVPGTYIVNVSLGAQRTMRFRTKRRAQSEASGGSQRVVHRVPLPHGSMVAMSLAANAKYLHGIKADKRPVQELLETEKAHLGQRISLTFRCIGTFVSEDEALIWGQGARAKVQGGAHQVINADDMESPRLLQAFGLENRLSGLSWDTIYGEGFDVLHLR